MASNHRKPGVHIAWTTITYRSLALLVLGFAAVAFISMRLAFPQFTRNMLEKAGDVASPGLEKVAGMAPATGTGVVIAQQAHFRPPDGTVRVKKGNGNTWVAADYSIPLENGDLFQTGSEGMEKILFTDGASHAPKQDSLMGIEENPANEQQPTTVAVAVSTRTVELSTAPYSQGSKSQVIVAGATASLARESVAQVHHDPKADPYEILIKNSAGEVTGNRESVQRADREKVSFQGVRSHLEKAKEIGPNTPIAPANVASRLSSNGAPTKNGEFSWTAMTNAVGYRLRISRNPYFSSTLVDKKLNTAAVTVTNLGEGLYYWRVRSYDGEGQDSVGSEKKASISFPRARRPKRLFWNSRERRRRARA